MNINNIFLTTANTTAEATSLFDIERIIDIGISTAIIFFLTLIALGISNKAIDKIVRGKNLKGLHPDDSRIDTIRGLIKSISKYLIIFIGILTFLSQFFNVASLVTVAGIGGAALGIGAKGLVEDFFSGLFIIMENNFTIGEYVTFENYSGIVESITLRTTTIHDFSGDMHIINNGLITTVTNHSRDALRIFVDVSIAYGENVDQVLEILNKICLEAKEEFTEIEHGPVVLGVNTLNTSSVDIRIMAKVNNLFHLDVQRELKKRILQKLKEENITIPFQTITIENINN